MESDIRRREGRRRIPLFRGFGSRRRGRHVVVHMVMVMVRMVVHVVMVVVHVVMHGRLRGHGRSARWRSGRRLLSDCVAGETNRESGGGNKTLDHGHIPPEKDPNGQRLEIWRKLPELKVNRISPDITAPENATSASICGR